ncbi:MAG: hypoxanthine phosphoribosyltransferase [Armatimonadetes bacterium]|nr:hypoxanthine phosphoribosyltransferase [Armatimonadota bacterium]
MAQVQIDVLLTEDQLRTRTRELAADIRATLADEPLVLIGVLKGCVPFIGDLARELSGDVAIDYVQVSSYGDGKTSTGVFQLKKDHDINIEGRHVVVVEDIVDSGLTLARLRELLATRRPASLTAVAMLSKPDARSHESRVEHVGFEIPNVFVVGYGLDHAESYRNLPFVGVLRESHG